MKKLPSTWLALLFTVSLGSCSTPEAGPEGPVDLRTKLAPPKSGYQIHSKPHIVKAGTEEYACDVVRIDPVGNEKLVWLNEFESETSKYSHHMNVMGGFFSLGDAIFGAGRAVKLLGKPEGQYDCHDLGDIMKTQGAQTLYPSQKTHQYGRFPSGVAVPILLPLVLIINHHFINTSDRDMLVDARVNFVSTNEAEVKHVATAFFGGAGVELEPNSRKIISKTCALDYPVNLFAISTHSHARASCFTLNFYDGLNASIEPKPFFVNKDWESPPIMFMDQQEWTGNKVIPMKAGDGIHWACHYENKENRKVTEGESAEDEMCIFVGVGYPNRISVDEVKEMISNPSLDALDRIKEALIGCNPVTEATSPWPHPNESFTIKSAGAPYSALHAEDSGDDECAGYETTKE